MSTRREILTGAAALGAVAVAGATITGMRAAFLERSGKALYPPGPDIEIKGKDMVAIADQLVAMPA